MTGGNQCSSDSDCGVTTGECKSSKCKCLPGWTGPACLVPKYSNNFSSWDENEMTLPFEELYLPTFMLSIACLFGVLFLSSLYLIVASKKRLLTEYTDDLWS